MSNPQSKLDALLAEARSETQAAIVRPSDAANALARLRTRRAADGRRYWRRAGLVGAAATLAAIILPLLTLSQQSAAAKLLTVLGRSYDGVFRQRIYDRQAGQWIWREDIVSDGTTSLFVRADGGEELFEADRTTTRDPRGFLTVTKTNGPAAAAKLPDLESLMKSECFNKVSGEVQGDETLYELSGSFRDGRNIEVRIEAQVKVDGLGRIASEEVKLEPNHHSKIEFTYELKPEALRLKTKDGEPIYDLDSQQEEVFEAIESPAPAAKAVRPVRAYVDEDGYLAVLVEVPPASESPRGEVRLDGKPMEAAYLNFNGHGARLGQTMEVPVRYGDRSYLLKSAKVSNVPRGPFRFEFPLWTMKDDFVARRPFAKAGPGAAWTAETARFTVPKVQRTSSVVRLLSPRNIPFFLEKRGAASGAPTQPSR